MQIINFHSIHYFFALILIVEIIINLLFSIPCKILNSIKLDANIIPISQTKLVCIVVPIHKSKLSKREILYTKNNLNFFPKYDKYIILPEKEKTDSLKNFSYFKFPLVHFIFVKTEFFYSIHSYNRLLTRCFFYKLFIKYKYILIVQTDVVICFDDLQNWCSKNYDYIGAPWKQFNPHVGNGGFSLRKVKSFINICCNSQVPYTRNEDMIFAKMNCLTKPNILMASLFAVETYPLYFLNLTKKIPFGFHKPFAYKVKNAIVSLFAQNSSAICNFDLL